MRIHAGFIVQNCHVQNVSFLHTMAFIKYKEIPGFISIQNFIANPYVEHSFPQGCCCVSFRGASFPILSMRAAHR